MAGDLEVKEYHPRGRRGREKRIYLYFGQASECRWWVCIAFKSVGALASQVPPSNAHLAGRPARKIGWPESG